MQSYVPSFNFTEFPLDFDAAYIINLLESDEELRRIRKIIWDGFGKYFDNNVEKIQQELENEGVHIDIRDLNFSFKNLSIIHNELLERGFTLKYKMDEKNEILVNADCYVDVAISSFLIQIPSDIVQSASLINNTVKFEELDPSGPIPKGLILSINDPQKLEKKKSLIKENEELKDIIKDLEQENTELKYTPDGKMYPHIEKHFSKCIVDMNIDKDKE